MSHQDLSDESLPVADASSAYCTLFKRLMRGMVVRPHRGIASGLPCVVPSSDIMTIPSTNSSEGFRYVLIRMLAKGGQRRRIYCEWLSVRLGN